MAILRPRRSSCALWLLALSVGYHSHGPLNFTGLLRAQQRRERAGGHRRCALPRLGDRVEIQHEGQWQEALVEHVDSGDEVVRVKFVSEGYEYHQPLCSTWRVRRDETPEARDAQREVTRKAADLEAGELLIGTVKSVHHYRDGELLSAVLDIGAERDAFLQRDDMVGVAREGDLEAGDALHVKVLSSNDARILLSMKGLEYEETEEQFDEEKEGEGEEQVGEEETEEEELEPDEGLPPLSSKPVQSSLEKDMLKLASTSGFLDGTIISKETFGAFVHVQVPGTQRKVWGVLHVAEMPTGFHKNAARWQDPLMAKDEVQVRVLKVAGKQLFLSMLQGARGTEKASGAPGKEAESASEVPARQVLTQGTSDDASKSASVRGDESAPDLDVVQIEAAPDLDVVQIEAEAETQENDFAARGLQRMLSEDGGLMERIVESLDDFIPAEGTEVQSDTTMSGEEDGEEDPEGVTEESDKPQDQFLEEKAETPQMPNLEHLGDLAYFAALDDEEKMKGIVNKFSDEGAWVLLFMPQAGKAVKALIPTDQISPFPVAHAVDVLSMGQTVEVRVKDVQPGKVTLTML